MEKITLYMDCYGFLHGTEKECKIIEDMEEVVLIEDINEDDYECVDERENTNEQLFCETIISPSVFLLNKRLCKEENQEQLEILFLLSLCTICEQASYEDISLYKVSVLIKNNVFIVEINKKDSSITNVSIEDEETTQWPNDAGFTYTWVVDEDSSEILTRACNSLSDKTLKNEKIVMILAEALAKSKAKIYKYGYHN